MNLMWVHTCVSVEIPQALRLSVPRMNSICISTSYLLKERPCSFLLDEMGLFSVLWGPMSKCSVGSYQKPSLFPKQSRALTIGFILPHK